MDTSLKLPGLIGGEIRFNPCAKPLYDYGLLYCNVGGKFDPVSSSAANALCNMFFDQMPTNLEPTDLSYLRALEAAIVKSIGSGSDEVKARVLNMGSWSEKYIPWNAKAVRHLPGNQVEQAAQHLVKEQIGAILVRSIVQTV